MMTYSPTGKTSQSGAQVLVARSAYVGMAREKKEPVGDGVNETVGDVEAAAL